MEKNIGDIIRTENLCKDYRLGKERIRVLHGIDLRVAPGQYVAIMGHSGAGKSTLLNILGCLDHPTSGSFYFRGSSIGDLKPSQRADIRNREIGFVFQNFNLLPRLDVRSNVELPLIYGNVGARRRREMVTDVLRSLGLEDRWSHKPNEISGGQKQRTAIARALVKKPSLILADEPTGNLDSRTTGEILDVLERLHAEGNTIVVITHEHDVAERASRVLHLVDGKLVQ